MTFDPDKLRADLNRINKGAAHGQQGNDQDGGRERAAEGRGDEAAADAAEGNPREAHTKTKAVAPDTEERARDERQLTILSLWEDGWTAGEIARSLNITRNAALAFIDRVNRSDPEALRRKLEGGV